MQGGTVVIYQSGNRKLDWRLAVRILVWAAFFILRATMGWFVFIKENKNFQVIKEKKLCIKIRQYRNLKYFFAKEKQFSGEFFFQWDFNLFCWQKNIRNFIFSLFHELWSFWQRQWMFCHLFKFNCLSSTQNSLTEIV